ncbi:MAG: family 78 glycoside hydrolase catalytic domain [Kiritimatiellae bacterium]|nr:family 78 glycoside hydrolase catalytic domain [Kiritimatiellia bacterium]
MVQKLEPRASTASPRDSAATDWSAKWIGFDQPVRLVGEQTNESGRKLPPPKYLRREFSLKPGVRKATLRASALGLYVIHLNGQRVGQDSFTPGWTDYEQRVYFNTYDVTEALSEGGNAIGAILADGWYCGYVGWGNLRERHGTYPRVLAQLDIVYDDGSSERIVTDASWEASTGPLQEADLLMGEVYDATREIPNWDLPGANAETWRPVDVTDQINAKIEPYPTETVQVFQDVAPVALTEPQPGTFVFDMGTNFAGVARLKVQAPAGTRLTLAYGERLLEDGTLLKANLRDARAEDRYICKGGELEVWQPHFTFHGFQYVSLTGYPGTPSLDTVTGVELSSGTPVVGAFSCSDERLNQLYHNICQTQRANFIDIPTDCPQRDERLGWTGDAQAYIRAAAFNTDVQRFFRKWLVDLTDAQQPNGDFPPVAPLIHLVNKSGGPAWSDAGIICPWALYEIYGDKAVLEKHYDAMVRFMAFREKSMTAYLPPEEYHCFGDWLNIDSETPHDVIFMAYTAGDAQIMAKVAGVLGKSDDAASYERLYANIKTAFNQAYVDPDGTIKGDTQTAYVLALWFDLLDVENKQKAEAHLIERIRERDWHLSTGFVGSRDLMHVLTKIGRTDIAYRLLFNDTFPSWLFPVKNGATSIWERWDSWTPEKGFQDEGMNSFSHYAYGAVGQWMFENIGGIRSLHPGFTRVAIRPIIPEQLMWASVSYRSVKGVIRVDWECEGDGVTLTVEIPAEIEADIHVPGTTSVETVEAGKHVFQGRMIR